MKKVKHCKTAAKMFCGESDKFSGRDWVSLLVTGASLVGALALAGCGGGGGGADSPVNTPPAAPPGPVASVPSVGAGTWVVMGSSTAAGTGVGAGKKWSDLLQLRLADRSAKIENIAKPGAVTYQGLSTATAPVPNRPLPDPAINIDQALSRTPVVLILAYPTNDTVSGYSVDEVINNLAAIRGAALSKGIPVLVLSTQPRNVTQGQTEQLKQIDSLLASRVGGCFVNVRPLLAGPDERFMPGYDSGDGIHPNEAGHRVIADAILATIDSGTCFKIKTT